MVALAGRTSSAAGMAFEAAPEYHVFPTRERPLKPYEAVVRATGQTRPLVADAAPGRRRRRHPHAGAGAGRRAARACRWRRVIPHVDPRTAPGLPPYSMGARLPRTAVGRRAVGRRCRRSTDARPGARAPRAQRDARAPGPAGPLDRVHGGISAARWRWWRPSPQLEYPRAVGRPSTHVVGPAAVGAARARTSELPPGDAPLVLVAPSTVAGSRRTGCCARRCAASPALPVRVLAARNRRPLVEPVDVPANARLVDWLSYARTMPQCDVVVCHGGHGTVARALASRAARVVVVPAGGRHERERRARRLGRRRRARAAAAVRAATRCAWPWSARWPSRSCASARAGWRRGRATTTARRARPSSSSSSPSAIRTSVRVVEREWLAERLEAGASIEAIAREAGRDPSTVSYWARKHGLTSAHAPRHAARGGIDRALLAEVVACELSVRDMAEVFDRSPTTIRHWLRRHRLRSGPTQRRAPSRLADAAGQRRAAAAMPAPRHDPPRAPRRRLPAARAARLRARRGQAS